MQKSLVGVGATLGFLAVALGAFGTHALRGRLSEPSLSIWQTGVQYQLAHALAILLVASLSASLPRVAVSGWLFAAGVMVFSGSLYLYAVTGIVAFAIVTPLGGLAFLAGWLWLAYAGYRGT